MKNLKLFYFILISLQILLSCSSDDNTTSQNIIIGEWQQIRTIEIDNNGNESAEDLTTCEKQGRLILNTNGSLGFLRFFEDDNQNCMEDDSFVNGSWEAENEEYTFNFVFFNSDTNSNQEFSQTPIEVTFPNENTMRIKELETESNSIEFFIAEFIRIN